MKNIKHNSETEVEVELFSDKEETRNMKKVFVKTVLALILFAIFTIICSRITLDNFNRKDVNSEITMGTQISDMTTTTVLTTTDVITTSPTTSNITSVTTTNTTTVTTTEVVETTTDEIILNPSPENNFEAANEENNNIREESPIPEVVIPPVTEVVFEEPTSETEEVIEEEQPIEEEIPSTENMTYLGNLRITGYVATGNPTASGPYPYVGGVAMSSSYGLPWGTKIYIEGLGTFELFDCGCDYGIVDVFRNSIPECYALIPYADVYVIN